MHQLTVEASPDTTRKLADLSALLEQIPAEVGDRLMHTFLSKFDGSALEFVPNPGSPASGARNGVLRFRIDGLDELIAAASRALDDKAVHENPSDD